MKEGNCTESKAGKKRQEAQLVKNQFTNNTNNSE